MNMLESLQSVNAYPVPLPALLSIAATRGLDPAQDTTKEQLESTEYKRAKADILMWLSFAPDIAQGGQSYSFTDEQRDQLRKQATSLYEEADKVEAGEETKPEGMYGFKGHVL